MLMASEDEMNEAMSASRTLSTHEVDAPPEVDPEMSASQPPLLDEVEDDHGVPASQSANEANALQCWRYPSRSS